MKQVKLLTKKKSKKLKSDSKTSTKSSSGRHITNPSFPMLPLDGLYVDPIVISCESLPDAIGIKPNCSGSRNKDFI